MFWEEHNEIVEAMGWEWKCIQEIFSNKGMVWLSAFHRVQKSEYLFVLQFFFSSNCSRLIHNFTRHKKYVSYTRNFKKKINYLIPSLIMFMIHTITIQLWQQYSNPLYFSNHAQEKACMTASASHHNLVNRLNSR